MRDLINPGAMWLKAVLFLAIGATGFTMLLIQMGTWSGALLLVLTIWALCRAYYFAFYVIEKYIDPSFRFSGLIAFLLYLLRRNRR